MITDLVGDVGEMLDDQRLGAGQVVRVVAVDADDGVAGILEPHLDLVGVGPQRHQLGVGALEVEAGAAVAGIQDPVGGSPGLPPDPERRRLGAVDVEMDHGSRDVHPDAQTHLPSGSGGLDLHVPGAEVELLAETIRISERVRVEAHPEAAQLEQLAVVVEGAGAVDVTEDISTLDPHDHADVATTAGHAVRGPLTRAVPADVVAVRCRPGHDG